MACLDGSNGFRAHHIWGVLGRPLGVPGKLLGGVGAARRGMGLLLLPGGLMSMLLFMMLMSSARTPVKEYESLCVQIISFEHQT